MSETRTGQVAAAAAEVYEEFFVPALFAEWAPRLCDAAMLVEGQSVVDIACGTGIAARTARERVGPEGEVTGVDLNDDMLSIARRRAPSTTWVRAPAESLPFESQRFDAAISQFGLMFYSDPVAALAEMTRVVRPGGQIAVAVWGRLQQTPGYAAMVQLLERLFDADTADALRAPYRMGDEDQLLALLRAAGMDARVATMPGRAHFPSIESWVHTDIRGWTLSDRIDDQDQDRLLAAALVELAPFIGPDGSVAFDHPALMATATVG
jgi:SAM-dependent methyltransferase